MHGESPERKTMAGTSLLNDTLRLILVCGA